MAVVPPLSYAGPNGLHLVNNVKRKFLTTPSDNVVKKENKITNTLTTEGIQYVLFLVTEVKTLREGGNSLCSVCSVTTPLTPPLLTYPPYSRVFFTFLLLFDHA